MESLVRLRQLRSIYDGKKVFLTGHTGFKGTWLNAILYKLGAIVKGYALEPEESRTFYELFKPYNFCQSIIADIRDKKRLQSEIISFQPDFVFHLAAQPLVLRSYEIPAETFEVNVTGTANVLESIISLKKKCSVLVVTTDKVYENKEQDVLYKESDRLGGHDPYSASKACTELVVDSFRSSFFNINQVKSHQKGIASARAGNVIGGGDWSANRIIPDTVKALLKNEPILIRNPNSVRPWQHVLEPLIGYLLLNGYLWDNPGQFSKAYNFGPFVNDHLTVQELVHLALKLWGNGTVELAGAAEKAHEASLLQLDIDQAIRELGWRPRLTASEAIRWTMEWYRKETSAQADFTFEQIDNYLSK